MIIQNKNVYLLLVLLLPLATLGMVAGASGQSIRGNLYALKNTGGQGQTMVKKAQVQGTVTDDSTGESLPGVNVVVKGTQQGTSTGGKGHYSLTVPSLQDTLVFSFIGYRTRQVPINGRPAINVTLKSTTRGLEELVVIGYGESEKRSLTGSVASVSADELNVGNVSSPAEMMQGKLSGVNVTMNSGRPGANSSIRIRGGTSITASNEPLYVIDGVPVSFNESDFSAKSSRQNTQSRSPLNMLSKDDIESISVLKGASATAVYGSRGANGVILVTTKKGTAGQTRLSYYSSVTVSGVRKKLNVLNADEFRNYINSKPELKKNWTGKNSSTNWQDQIFRTAVSQSHTLGLSGGNKTSTYFASLNYSDDKGILIASGQQKIGGRLNLEHKISFLGNDLNLKLNYNGADINSSNAPNPNTTGSNKDGGLIRDALHQDPTWPVKNEAGSYTYQSIYAKNPVEQANTLIDKTDNYRQMGNMTLDYNLTSFLTSHTNLGFTKENVNRNFYAPTNSQVGRTSNGIATRVSRNDGSGLLETELRFKGNFNKNSIKAFAAYSYQKFVYSDDYMAATDFPTDITKFNSIGTGRNQIPPTSHKKSNKLISVYGRARYNYANKYYLTATVRRDGSSRFGADNKWGIFPAFAASWRPTAEKFISQSNILSDLKIRVSYGITGNQDIGDYKSLAILSAGENTYIIGGERIPVIGENQIATPNLKWEKTAQTDIGIDFGFLKDRLSGTLDIYKKHTTDLLLNFSVPAPSVVSSTIANVGSLNNKGIEFSLKGIILQKGPLNWGFNLNVNHNQQTVESLSNDTYSTKEIHTGNMKAPGFTLQQPKIIRPGNPTGSFYGLKYLGNSNSGQEFKDLNGDGQINTDDYAIIGNSQPNINYGFSSHLSYKRLNFSFSLTGVQGNDVFNAMATDISKLSQLPGLNVLKSALETDNPNQPLRFSSRYIENGSYLRLQDMTISYNLNVKAIQGLSRANIYLKGQNLLVLTKYTGYDPELPDGIDYAHYPRPSSFIFGIKLLF